MPPSEGLLGFPVPTRLDSYGEPNADGDRECLIVLEISGGAPPFTIYHDLSLEGATGERVFDLRFRARGCSGISHTITVESGDGQSATQKYHIKPPWCES
jgi:hypothetical protein